MVLRPETATTIFGTDCRAFAVHADENGRIINQTIKLSGSYREERNDYRITVELRFDDSCGNGHETFAITANIRENGREYMGGCCHEEIAKHFPALAPLIKWHLCSTDGPMHYPANALYFASERDCHGLLKGEFRPHRNKKTGLPEWHIPHQPAYDKTHEYIQSETKPAPLVLEYEQFGTLGEGKARELDHARSSAIWPDATDAELCAPDLADKLKARLPGLLAEFKDAMNRAGFLWPEHKSATV